MHELYKLAEMLCEELEDQAKNGELNAGNLENIDKLSHALKNVYKIIESIEEMEEEGYSNAMNYGGNSYRGGAYRGNSYAGGRGRYARRDSMGRYSRERGYSRDAGEMIEQLRDMEQTAPDEQTRQDIQRLISNLEQHR